MIFFNIKSPSGHKTTPPSVVSSVCVLEAASVHVTVVYAEQLTSGLYYEKVLEGSKINSGLTKGFQF